VAFVDESQQMFTSARFGRVTPFTSEIGDGMAILSTVITLLAPKAVVRGINDYLSRGPRYFGAGEPSDQKPTGMTIVTGSYRRKVDVAGERMGDPSKPAAHVGIWSYATNGIT
jgi:hypothetical protein